MGKMDSGDGSLEGWGEVVGAMFVGFLAVAVLLIAAAAFLAAVS